jgi:hypothetical protein
METEEEQVPSETDTLLGGESGDEFDLVQWEMRLRAGKYDGHIIEMAAMLYERAIVENTRRWRCTFRDCVYTEEDVSGEVAEHAEMFASQGWGYLTALMGDNVRSTIRPARAILYGICRGELKMTDRDARRAIKMTAQDTLACFDWYEVPSPGKSVGPE